MTGHFIKVDPSTLVRHIHAHSKTILHIVVAYSNPLGKATIFLHEKVSSIDDCDTVVMHWRNTDTGALMFVIHFTDKPRVHKHLFVNRGAMRGKFQGYIKDYMYH